MSNMKEMIVALDGSGQFQSIQAAVDCIPDNNETRVNIHVKKGVYHEKVFIDKPFVSLLGEDADNTVVEYGDYALMKGPDGQAIRTFWTYTLFAGGRDFKAENLTIVNSAGKGDVVGQAVTAYVDGDRAQFVNCRLIGNQDTLFTGPLPPYPLTVKTFGGPRDGHPRLKSRQYYKNCYIRGDIDFIFGSATAVFDACEVFSNRLKPGQESYITAPSTPEAEKYGYVFVNCRLTGDAEPKSVYLGRPWRNFGKAAFINCRMGPHIREEGWHNWDKPESEKTTEFAEYNSTGPGGEAARDGCSCRESSAGGRVSRGNVTGGRVSWAKQLTPEEAELYGIEKVLSGQDGWNPQVDTSPYQV